MSRPGIEFTLPAWNADVPHAYDSSYVWSFPSLPVTIRQTEGEQATAELPALLDTGADATLVPTVHLESVGAERIQWARIGSHWGDWRSASIYVVDMEIAGHILPAVDVVGDEAGDTILLGRTVLNLLILLLDGPRQQTDVLARRPLRF